MASIKFTTALGGSFYAKPEDARLYFREPEVIKFLCLCSLVVIVYRSNTHLVEIEELVSGNIAFLFHAVAALFVLAMMIVAFLGLVELTIRGVFKIAFVPLITLPTAMSIQFVTAAMVRAITGDWPNVIFSVEEFLEDGVVILAFEAMFAMYVAPSTGIFSLKPFKDVPDTVQTELGGQENGSHPIVMHENTRPQAGVAPALAQETVVPRDTQARRDGDDAKGAREDGAAAASFASSVGDIGIDDFVYVRSKGHYLHFYSHDREITVRGNLRSVSEQLGPLCGVQVNRSAWVAFHAVLEIVTEDGKTIVKLSSGHVERVSEARKLAVSMAHEAYVVFANNPENERSA